jgi:hypothetical protein
MSNQLSIEHVAARLGVESWIIDAAIRNGRLTGTYNTDGVFTTSRAVRVWLGGDVRGGC